MKKIFNIAWKDIKITLNDPAALILTIATPFALTLVMIFAFGGVEDSGISGIPVVIVNQDESDLGKNLVDVFESKDLADLVAPTLLDDPVAARAAVDNDDYAAAVIIPTDFGDGLMPSGMNANSDPDQPIRESDVSGWVSDEREQAVIEIYGNPTRPTSVSVVRTIVDEFIHRATAMVSGFQVSIGQMLKTGMLNPTDPKSAFMDVGEFSTAQSADERFITLQSSMVEGSLDTEFDWFGYIAPSMALLFLMFTITNGGVFGSLLSTPILNPPQSAILGMHSIQQRPVALNGEVVIRPMMYLALSYDHRIVDGKEAVQFLVSIKNSVEDPTRLLLDLK